MHKQGIVMLSGLLKNDIAVQVSIPIYKIDTLFFEIFYFINIYIV